MLTRYFESKTLRFHFFMALLLGFVFRSFSAFFAFGPQALDDYLNQMLPALRLMRGFVHDLPAYRSPLVPWIIELWLNFGRSLSITATVDLIRWTYWGLGIISLLAIYGAYIYFSVAPFSMTTPSRSSRSEITFGTNSLAGPIALYLIALHGLLPFISTRSFLESMSMPFVTLGICFLYAHFAKPSFKFLQFALLSLGLATLIRFQVGLLYLYAFVLVLAFALVTRIWKYLVAAMLTSIFIFLIQLSFEFFDQRPLFSILLSYFKANQNTADYGASPWHSTWATWLAIFYLPFSFIFLTRLKVLKDHWMVLTGVLIFVLAHSLIPHKEERFLYPIIGLSLILMSILWSEVWQSRINRFFFIPVFALLNTFLLIVGSFSNTQLGEIGVPAAMEKHSTKLLYLSHDSMVDQGYMYELFIQPPAQLHKINNAPNFESWDRFSKLLTTLDGVVVMTSNPSYQIGILQMAKASYMNFTCSELQTMNSLTDRWIYQMSPEKNYRRRPTWFILCSRAEFR